MLQKQEWDGPEVHVPSSLYAPAHTFASTAHSQWLKPCSLMHGSAPPDNSPLQNAARHVAPCTASRVSDRL